MDQRACEAGRILDIRRHERLQREHELEKLKWELEHLKEMEEPANEDTTAEQVIFPRSRLFLPDKSVSVYY